MRISLENLLSQKKLVLADGALGTNFMQMGLMPGDPPDLWNLTDPEKPETLHQAFVDAGSDILLTNTFGANAPRLKLHDAQDQTYAINKAGAEIACKVAERADRPVVVGGSVGPTGELFEPMGAMTFDSAKAEFVEQIRGLKDGGADVVWIETMSATEEIDAAIAAALDVGMPYVFTASFDTAGRTMMGVAPDQLDDVACSHDHGPVAYGANCGVGASDMMVAALAMTSKNPNAVIVTKANCGIPIIKGKETVYSGTPEMMADFVRLAANAGVRIIGGCCGTRPAHIAAMRIAINSFVQSERPNVSEIKDKLGDLVSPAANESAPRRTRRRRA